MASPISASVLIAEKVARLADEAQAPGHCGYSVSRFPPMPCLWMNASASAQPANSASVQSALLGCLLRAKDARLLDAIAPVISELQELAGCWFDDALIAGTLRVAGELV